MRRTHVILGFGPHGRRPPLFSVRAAAVNVPGLKAGEINEAMKTGAINEARTNANVRSERKTRMKGTG